MTLSLKPGADSGQAWGYQGDSIAPALGSTGVPGVPGPEGVSTGLQPSGGACRRPPLTGQEEVGKGAAEGRVGGGSCSTLPQWAQPPGLHWLRPSSGPLG